jgi:hypothetical protein
MNESSDYVDPITEKKYFSLSINNFRSNIIHFLLFIWL